MICEAVILILVTYALYRLLISYLDVTPNVKGRTVFITGCDYGFGHDLALKCLQNGMTVLAGCFSDEGATKLRAEAAGIGGKSAGSQSSPTGKLHTIRVDVTSDESVENASKEATALLKGNGLDALVNNAGIAAIGLVDWITVKDYQKVLDVNLFGVIRTTQAFSKLVKKNKGRIVNASSIFSFLSFGTISQYCVSKFAVRAYTDALRTEYKPFGVTVCALEPGFYRTQFSSPERNLQQLKKLVDGLSNEIKEEYGNEYFEKTLKQSYDILDALASTRTYEVVDAYFHAVTSNFPRTIYHLGRDYYFFFFLSLWPSVARDYLQYFGSWMKGIPKPKGAR
ncbi:unnamed protein product [Bursaphelenchus xylophilus]|uniref:(pine wood nematode) hypothetical protein n=1 Tax=Bursaphelenchus xylophilus TaxID=6326 RepID=A0A1I7RJT6_BURXY|nr:unnamed protein product [Bursaphelenchus xylophilus]CAG9129058.1 unnamed protein product [Bursaphelenchus xylophilus]